MNSPLQDLLDSLEAWCLPEHDINHTQAVFDAYAAYKASPKPLVLETVDWNDVSEWGFAYTLDDSSHGALIRYVRMNSASPRPIGQCYRLPEDKP